MTLTAPVAQLRTVVLGRGRSTTRRAMLALSAVLLITTAAVFATSLAVFTRTYDTADTVRARTAPAVQDILAARAALVHADQAAIAGFSAGAALTGVGEDFQIQLSIASQSLTRVAQENMAGSAGIRRLQLVEGLLVNYTGLVGLADANLRQTGGVLGVADLLGASRLLHRKGSGILAQLDSLLGAQRQALDEQLAASATSAGTVVAIGLPILVLAAGLVATHLFFRRRFRRRLNPALALAALLLVALAVVAFRPIGARQDLADTRTVLNGLVSNEQSRVAAHDRAGQWQLRELLADNACDNGACGTTVADFYETAPKPATASNAGGEAALARETAAVAARVNAANAGAGLVFLVYVLAILIVAAVVVAFRPRLHEYRYRPR
jgi:hypothetical protein